MAQTTANNFRENLKSEVDQCIARHEVLHVSRRNGEDFVVLGLEDWKAIEETLLLNRVPGLVKSIQQAAQEPLSKGKKLEELEW